MRASGEIGRQLSLEGEQVDVLLNIVKSIEELASADVVSPVFPGEDHPEELQVVVTTGTGAERLTGLRYPKHGSPAWQAMNEGRGIIVDSVEEIGDPLQVRPFVAIRQTGSPEICPTR